MSSLIKGFTFTIDGFDRSNDIEILENPTFRFEGVRQCHRGGEDLSLLYPVSTRKVMVLNPRLGMCSGSARPLVDPKSDTPSCMHDDIVPVCAHCNSLWLLHCGDPAGY